MTIGDWGFISVITAIVLALLSGLGYFRVSQEKKEISTWKKYARVTFLLHTAAVFTCWALLLWLFFHHRYDYHYVWEHVANDLPWYYVLSSIWEGQEGSFLLWIFWHTLIGLIFTLFFFKKVREHALVMMVLCCLQALLLSMVLGVYIPGTEVFIGKSPFLTLQQATQSSIFINNPDFVPTDGNGLNILLQNGWMAIHPPVVFLGYALASVPFGYVMQGLFQKRYRAWMVPGMFWTTVTVAVIGLGILMGAWWAYETLNFGGYWSWDPVENAVFIPWIVLLAALHAMVRYHHKGKGLHMAILLPIAGYLLLVYATYLTRSGILGNASVHSFTESGLGGQLVTWLLLIAVVPAFLLLQRWNSIVSRKTTKKADQKDIWMVLGIVVLLLSAFQLFIPLSIPVFNVISGWFGGNGNMALPAEPMRFYGKFQLIFALLIAFLSAWTQQYYIGKRKRLRNTNVYFVAVAFSLIAVGFFVLLTHQLKLQYWLYMATAVFCLIINGYIFIRLFRDGKAKLVGGVLAHVGLAILLVGVLFSSVLDSTVTQSTFADGTTNNHTLLKEGDLVAFGDYKFVYRGEQKVLRSTSDKIAREHLLATNVPNQWIAAQDMELSSGKTVVAGERVVSSLEGSLFAIDVDYKGDRYTIHPTMKRDKAADNAVFSPHIIHRWDRDIFLHVSNLSDEEAPRKYTAPEQLDMEVGTTKEVKGMQCTLTSIDEVDKIPGVYVFHRDTAYQLTLAFQDGDEAFELHPYIHIREGQQKMYEDRKAAAGIAVVASQVDHERGRASLSFAAVNNNWITIQATEKPGIGLFWMGGLLMLVGLMVAAVRSVRRTSMWPDYQLSRHKVSPEGALTHELLQQEDHEQDRYGSLIK